MLLAITRNAFLILRRDRIFLPVVVVLGLCTLLATIAGEWSISRLFDTTIFINTLSFHLVGLAISIFWGVQSVGGAIDDGSIEIELSGPCPKELWTLGRFLGLVLVILAVFGMFLGLSTTFLFLTDTLIYLKSDHLVLFLGHLNIVLIVASVAFCLSTFVNQGLALFASASLWFAGMVSPMILLAVQTEISDIFTSILSKFVVVWNLQRLNFLDAIFSSQKTFELSSTLPNFLYGLSIMGFFLTVTCLRVRKMELTRK